MTTFLRITTKYLAAARLIGIGLLVSASLAGCISYQPAQMVPTINLSPEDMRLIDNSETGSGGIDFGLLAAFNESDSLINIEILPGVRVRGVNPGSPASSAGIQVGDVILAIDGLAVNDPDVLTVLEQQTITDSTFEFEVRRNTTVFLATVNARLQGSAVSTSGIVSN